MIQLSVENINRNTHLILETIQISQVSQDICEFFCVYPEAREPQFES